MLKWVMKDPDFLVRKAEPSDLASVLFLLQQAGRWLQTKNTTQWDYYVTDLQENTEEVSDSIDRVNTYIVESDNGECVASITLEMAPTGWDRSIWGDDAKKDDAVYLHRIVVNRKFAGKEVGSDLIKWAVERAKEKGKKRIRFDCLARNVGLNRYYQKWYRRVGIADIYGQHSKYEMEL